MVRFANRKIELRSLEAWWDAPQGTLGLVWGRRRVGKTVLLQEFARSKRSVFHTGGGRPLGDELRILSRAARTVLGPAIRDLAARPFVDWDDALEPLAGEADREPLLLVLDEFP